jgi:CRP/FNR family cyclic AMP-dependent transcriptional regulator
VRLGRRGITRNEKVKLIRSVPLFARCSRKELGEIAAIADEIDLPQGKALIRQGERGREFFVLLGGEVEIARDGEPIDTMAAGDFFGEIALVSKVPRTATVTATSPVRVLVVTDRDFRTLLEDSPQIQLKVLEALAERLAQLETRET